MTTIVKTEELTIGSTVFSNKGYIPTNYTCEGENINPSITVENIPSGTKSLALIVDDPDGTDGVFDHWIIWNIHPMEMIIENTAPGTEGKNSFGKTSYQGPCPPEGKDHRYFFKVYALDTLLDLKKGFDKKSLEKAMQDHILAKGEIIGMYKRTKHKNL